MTRQVLAVSFALGAVLRGPTCGNVDSPESGIHAPCTRDKDCAAELVCTEGVCVAKDAGVTDAATDATDAGDG